MSLTIYNFFLGTEEYTTATGSVYVDLVDYANHITTATGTYFIINNTIVSGTFSALTVSGAVSAYRMFYDPIDDFSSLMGPTEFTVKVSNNIGQTTTKDYSLTYGYKVDFENMDREWIDFDFDNHVVVRMTAENLASCPKTTANAYWFETKQQPHSDLSVSIRGSYINDLTASIYPDSTAYFYGKTYRLVVTAKDYSGNEMEPFVLVYTIENET